MNIDRKSLVLSVLMWFLLSAFFSVPVPENTDKILIVYSWLTPYFSVLVAVGYYFFLAGGEDEISLPQKPKAILTCLFIFGLSAALIFVQVSFIFESFYNDGLNMFQLSSFLLVIFLAIFIFKICSFGLSRLVLIVFFEQKKTEALANKPAESFYKVGENSAGRMPN